MQFFLDTASLEEIAKWETLGLVQGVTTNPTLLSKETGDALSQLKKIARVVNGPVSAQVTHDTSAAMLVQGRALSRLAENIVVKLPATLTGFEAAKTLAAEGISCNITLTFDPAQAISFCLLPVTYVSLIIGRPEDFGHSSLELGHQLRSIIDGLNSPTQFLAASIRNSHHLFAAIQSGADVITVPPSTWANVYANPLTAEGERDFFRAWQSLSSELRENYEQLS